MSLNKCAIVFIGLAVGDCLLLSIYRFREEISKKNNSSKENFGGSLKRRGKNQSVTSVDQDLFIVA